MFSWIKRHSCCQNCFLRQRMTSRWERNRAMLHKEDHEYKTTLTKSEIWGHLRRDMKTIKDKLFAGERQLSFPSAPVTNVTNPTENTGIVFYLWTQRLTLVFYLWTPRLTLWQITVLNVSIIYTPQWIKLLFPCYREQSMVFWVRGRNKYINMSNGINVWNNKRLCWNTVVLIYRRTSRLFCETGRLRSRCFHLFIHPVCPMLVSLLFSLSSIIVSIILLYKTPPPPLHLPLHFNQH